MKTSIVRFALFATSVFALSEAANAMLLVGWHDFDGTSSTTSGSTAPEVHDDAATGFSGVVTKGGQFSVGAAGSSDGFYGNSSYAAGPGGDGYARVYQTSQLIFSLTNDSGPVLQLDKLFFDAMNSSTFTVAYQIAGSPGLPTTISTGSGLSNGYASFGYNLLGFNISLLAGQTVNFIFTSPGGTRIDNVAISAIPEPASLMALGCVLGSGLLMRNRRRMA